MEKPFCNGTISLRKELSWQRAEALKLWCLVGLFILSSSCWYPLRDLSPSSISVILNYSDPTVTKAVDRYAYREKSQAFLKYEALHRQNAATKGPLQKILPKQFCSKCFKKSPWGKWCCWKGRCKCREWHFDLTQFNKEEQSGNSSVNQVYSWQRHNQWTKSANWSWKENTISALLIWQQRLKKN